MRRLIIAVLMAASAIMPAMAAEVSQEAIAAEAEPIAIPSMDGSDAKAVSLPADATYEDLGYGRSVLMSSKNPDEVAQVEKPAFIDEVLSDDEDSRGAYIHTKDFTAGDLTLTANFYGRHVDIIYPENITKGDIDSFAAELMEASDGAFQGIYYMVYEDLHLVAVSYPEGMGADEAEAWADNIMSFLSAYLGYSSPIDTAVLTTASLMPDNLLLSLLPGLPFRNLRTSRERITGRTRIRMRAIGLFPRRLRPLYLFPGGNGRLFRDGLPAPERRPGDREEIIIHIQQPNQTHQRRRSGQQRSLYRRNKRGRGILLPAPPGSPLSFLPYHILRFNNLP